MSLSIMKVPHVSALPSFLVKSFVFLVAGIACLFQGGWYCLGGIPALLLALVFGAAAGSALRDLCRNRDNRGSRLEAQPKGQQDPTVQSLIQILLVVGILFSLLSGSCFYRYQQVGVNGTYTELTRTGAPIERTGRYALTWGIISTLIGAASGSVSMGVWWKTRR